MIISKNKNDANYLISLTNCWHASKNVHGALYDLKVTVGGHQSQEFTDPIILLYVNTASVYKEIHSKVT